MKSYLAVLGIVCLLLASCESKKPKVLVFSRTKGYRHQSIPVGKQAIIDLGKARGFDVDTTENASLLNEDNLKNYSAVLFLSTTMDVLDPYQQGDLKRFIQAGGGYVGIHAAADTEYGWPWYGKLVGAYFLSHPKIQEAHIKKVEDFGEAKLPADWVRTDEWYNYKKISPDIKVILNLDESSYEGGANGAEHPIAWYHDFDGGRAFYTGLGHTDESYKEPEFLDHLYAGIKYAIGDNKLDYSKVRDERVPEENRFTKTVLDFNLNEPTEMTVLPDGRIIFVERKGDVKLYTPEDGKVNVINTFTPGTKFEDGMIGLTADPDFANNHWLYLFYSHPERSANVLSRFSFVDGKIDIASEKELLAVETQRETCCHTGGSLQFGPGNNLFISTGDNTSPFESDGFSPSDERKGRSPFDAQKSSANTNDLRGKILRIHPEPDGTYTIPDGNLFPKGQEGTRPEIYVMGCRNPYRISVDQRTGWVYWGEVGPDAGGNDSIRGPRGYDEVNQAKQPGFFGWPYFVGNNYAYARYDFAAGKTKGWNDPLHPVNESPNNTGIRDLPPATPAMVWYPYAASDDFPMVKEGGRNAMAGPVFYSDDFAGVATAFPKWFNNKLIIYDWMRNWMFLVSLDKEGKIVDMEPFMENTKFNNIMDMQFGPDGKLYMLEYGTQWFAQNLDARLVRIDYNAGNRAPVVALDADKLSGAVPLAVNFTTDGSMDYDTGDKLTYELEVDGKKYSGDSKFAVTFDKPGIYNPKLTVTDDKGLSSSTTIQIIAGNAPPEVKVEITQGNKSFFFPQTPVYYAVTVNDKEDGTTTSGISAADVNVTFDYLEGFDVTKIEQSHKMPTADLPGKVLMDESDCKSCHLIDKKSAGPAYLDVANKYKGQRGSSDYLAAKIIKGGAGVWGTTEMAAHPQISVDDAKKMVDYIFSLTSKKESKSLPLSGSVTPEAKQAGAYVLKASYADKAIDNVPSLSGTGSVVLRAPMLRADQANEVSKAVKASNQGFIYLDQVKNGGYARYNDIDLTGVKTVMATVTKFGDATGGSVELRLDAPDGKVIGTTDFSKADHRSPYPGVDVMTSPVTLTPTEGAHTLYIVFVNPGAGDKTLFFFQQLILTNK